jgi:transcriptional regulator with XRE-family HTH domain
MFLTRVALAEGIMVNRLGDLHKIVGTNVAKARKKAGLSQKELAAVVGVNKQTIWRIEAGSTNVTLETIGKLAAALTVTAEDLFSEPMAARPAKTYNELVHAALEHLREALRLATKLRPALKQLPGVVE